MQVQPYLDSGNEEYKKAGFCKHCNKVIYHNMWWFHLNGNRVCPGQSTNRAEPIMFTKYAEQLGL